MPTWNRKSGVASRQERAEVRILGQLLPTFDKELVIVRTGSPEKVRAATRRSEQANVMVPRGRALSKPGISKDAIFQGRANGKIFAYSVDPTDITRIVREKPDGTRRIGRVAGGKFSPAE